MPGLRLERREGRLQQGRRAADEDAHVRHRRAGQAGMGGEADVEGRDAHQDRRARHVGEHRISVETLVPEHGRAVEQRPVQGHEQAVDMIDG